MCYTPLDANDNFMLGGGANIELGDASNGIVVSDNSSKNTHGWSCLHLLQSENSIPCTNVTITNNQIDPCGNEGKNSAGNAQWVDGISFACQDSLVQNNNVGIGLYNYYFITCSSIG